ncbi:hypothetical protein FisN_4Hh506 [Fistulifera solaris]|uniref:NodB homology domain-containing protein n=1 Tax=Fistulifera solaris TaxID=1519565 RepID=A0A1Z5KIB4_FISSO|nr:hypothetical protein FisN_4Hh506 [Fistulifera solaris]|eukprot:GAX25999.1 hypothetical protein FisN_4Hh506 [Fistulifera solaris]
MDPTSIRPDPPSKKKASMDRKKAPAQVWKSHHENDGLTKYGGRDLLGYGEKTPIPKWPGYGKVALNFVINYEEGGERCLLHGDKESEKLLSEIVGAAALEDKRHYNMESLYDYGSRAGFWRLHRLFLRKKIPATVFAVGMALERNPAVCHALKEAPGWEIASHGYRWIDYQDVDEETEREHIKRTVEIHKRLIGKRPTGFYQGKPNVNTRKYVMEEGGFKYDSDSYADDLPYWTFEGGFPHLIIPYTLSENDMKFVSPGGFSSGDDFCTYLKNNLRYLVEEGRAGHPKMMTVGLHCRLARPGRVAAISEFMDFAKSYGRDVWICTREEIADFWSIHHAPIGGGRAVQPSLSADDSSVQQEETETKESGDVFMEVKF